MSRYKSHPAPTRGVFEERLLRIREIWGGYNKDKPRGSKYLNTRILGPQIHTLNGFWTLKPYHLGTWTLWESVCVCVQLCLKEPIRMMQGAEGLISRPLPMKLRGIETGKRTCSGRHGHMSAACGQHYSDMSAWIATVMSEGLQQS